MRYIEGVFESPATCSVSAVILGPPRCSSALPDQFIVFIPPLQVIAGQFRPFGARSKDKSRGAAVVDIAPPLLTPLRTTDSHRAPPIATEQRIGSLDEGFRMPARHDLSAGAEGRRPKALIYAVVSPTLTRFAVRRRGICIDGGPRPPGICHRIGTKTLTVRSLMSPFSSKLTAPCNVLRLA